MPHLLVLIFVFLVDIVGFVRLMVFSCFSEVVLDVLATFLFHFLPVLLTGYWKLFFNDFFFHLLISMDLQP